MINIAIDGLGYLDIFNIMLLAQRNEVADVDKVPEKVEFVNAVRSRLMMLKLRIFC